MMLNEFPFDEQYHYLVYDDVCKLCNGWVRFVIRRDKKDVFRFIALNSDIGQSLQRQSKLQDGDESVILRSGTKLFTLSDVSFECFRLLGGVWWSLYIFKIIPAFIRNAVYRLIAKNRYRWFGKHDQCPLIPRELQHKFID